MEKKVLNIAHRGASGQAPENTMAAFRLAIEQGADAIELDLHQTADGHLVILHDFSLKRTTGDSRSVNQVPLSEIKTLDAGLGWDQSFQGEGIPTLDEVLELTLHRIPLHIDLKHGSPFYPMIENRLIELIRRKKAYSWVTVSSFEVSALEFFLNHDPEIALGLLTRLKQPKIILPLARRLGVRSLHLSTRRFSKSILEQAQTQGIPVYVYTVNSQSDMKEYIHLGVNGIFTDFPDRLASLLDHLKSP